MLNLKYFIIFVPNLQFPNVLCFRNSTWFISNKFYLCYWFRDKELNLKVKTNNCKVHFGFEWEKIKMPSRERERGQRHCVRDRFFFGQKKDLCLSVSHSLRNQTKKLESNVQLKEKDSFTSRLIFSYRLTKV